MYLRELHIKNFRAIEELTLSFNDGVNILVGENNSGKSGVIDALRIALSYGKQWRDIGVSATDFYIDRNNLTHKSLSVEFHLKFEITKPEESGWFIELLSVDPSTSKSELQLHYQYTLEEKKEYTRVKWKVWGGDKEGQNVPNDVMDRFYFVYLEPLRDALQYLKPAKNNKTGQLFSNIVTDENQREVLANKVKSNLHSDPDWNNVIDKGETSVNEHLLATTIAGKGEKIDIDFLPFEFRRLVENLRIQIPIYSIGALNGNVDKQRYFELHQNGLGLNNLIYTATVLGNLFKKNEIEAESYLALLIEEPEAHLHPQLQNVLFSYLSSLNAKGFQVFISSHSPTITAKANLDSLIVLQKQLGKIFAISLKQSTLTADNKVYLHKFLDVTKSQLFFANGVLMVEGISEALLLPVLAKMITLVKDGPTIDLTKLGIEIVNINGVAFSHFAALFNSTDENKRLAAKGAILTDDDQQDGEESSRAISARTLESGNLKVYLSKVTFEYELYVTGNNAEILKKAYSSIRPKAAKNVLATGTLEEQATSFVESVVKNKAKSELAHALAVLLDSDVEAQGNFQVPEYIVQAVKWSVGYA